VVREDGLPRSALFKIAFDPKDGNVYSNKIVIMDEVHNLIRSQTQYLEQLTTLRGLLSKAKGGVLAGFTGTPILSETHEGRQLLDIIKGVGAGPEDEGFISSFPMRPTPLFPSCLPAGVPDAVLTAKLRRSFVEKVPLDLEALQRYDDKLAKGSSDRRLRAYCCMSVFFGSFHSGKHGTKARVLANFASCAPKLERIAREVASSPLKSLVMVDRHSGMSAILEYLRELGAAQGFGVATMDEIVAFNSASSNLRGEKYRVLVADASTCSEGVSFFGVRRVFLADVPSTPSGLVQAVGRSIRMYSHRGLPVEEQTVTTRLYVATFPRWMRSPLGAWALRSQRKHTDPREATRNAKQFLRTLKKVGITSLEDFKSQLDQFGKKAPPMTLPDGTTKKAPLEASECVRFLESIGLWEEAKAIKNSEEMMPGRRSKRTNKGEWKSAKPGSKQLDPKVAEEKRMGRHFMVRALSKLHSTSLEDAVKDLHLNVRTADEEALSMLADRSRKFVPALDELRSKAVDRDVLLSLRKKAKQEVTQESDGETSVDEFELSSGEESNLVDAQLRDREMPLVLPEGWRVEEVQRGKVRRRVFVSATGEQYNTEAQAKIAVAEVRRAENMMKRLRSRFSAKFANAAGAAPAPATDSAKMLVDSAADTERGEETAKRARAA